MQGEHFHTVHAHVDYLSIDILPYANVEIIVADPLDGCMGAPMDGSAATSDAITGSFADGSMVGKIALIIRGACYFTSKAINAQNAGAVAVVIYNDRAALLADDPGRMNGPWTHVGVTIPAVFLDDKAAGDRLALAVQQRVGPSTVSLHCCPLCTAHPGCISCAPGHYDHDSSPTTECIPCPRDTYTNEVGAVTCQHCPPGLFSPAGSLTVDDCGFTEPAYLGCYKDGPISWDTVVIGTNDGIMEGIDLATESRDTCGFICRDYAYMGLTWSSQCRWYDPASPRAPRCASLHMSLDKEACTDIPCSFARSGNEYGSAGLADLNDDGTSQCGEGGMSCAVGKLNSCPVISSIYTVSRTVTCGHLGDVCGEGTALKANALDIRAEVGSPDVQADCCATSCAAWNEAGNTCDVPGSCSDDTSTTQEACEGADCDGSACQWTAPQTGMFISDGAEGVSIGVDPQLSCCTRPCAAGYAADESGRCQVCPAGTAPAASGTGCEMCGSGSYVPAGSPDCTACLAGKHDDDFTSTTPCNDCPAGSYTIIPGYCDGVCPAGTYAAAGSASASDCEECASGQYDDDRDSATSCLSCAAGSFSPDSLTCTGCPADTFSNEGSIECSACPTGRFSEAESPSEADCACPTGLYKAKEYAGRVRDAVGLTLTNGCVSCAEGTQISSLVAKCPKDDMVLDWEEISGFAPSGYPAGMYPTGITHFGRAEFDPKVYLTSRLT